MEEGDALAFSAEPGYFIDETDAGRAAAIECAFDVVHRETDVVDAWAALGDELADRRIARACLQQLDEAITGREAGNARTVGIVERDFGQVENIAVEGKDGVETGDGHANMCDTGRARSGGCHAWMRWCGCAGAEY